MERTVHIDIPASTGLPMTFQLTEPMHLCRLHLVSATFMSLPPNIRGVLIVLDQAKAFRDQLLSHNGSSSPGAFAAVHTGGFPDVVTRLTDNSYNTVDADVLTNKLTFEFLDSTGALLPAGWSGSLTLKVNLKD